MEENIRSLFPILRARQRSNGFSLLEVTVAIAILSIAIAFIIQLYSMNLNSIRKADLYTQAIIYARSAMDEMLSSSTLENANESDLIDEQFEVEKTIAAIDGEDEDLAQTYEITVNVSWQGGSFELKTRKSILKSDEE